VVLLRRRSLEGPGLRPTPAKRLSETLSGKQGRRGCGGLAQAGSLEFKPWYCQRKKNSRTKTNKNPLVLCPFFVQITVSWPFVLD
jgi:hypothetical protein